MLPLKVLIFGVPMYRPNVRAVISCPMSGPAGAGHGGCCGGPKGTLPQLVALELGWVASIDPHLPPPGKVTSWSSSSGSLLPDGHTQSLGGGCWGHSQFALHNLLCEILYELSELIIEVSKLSMEMIQYSFTWRSLLGRECAALHPLWLASNATPW